MESLSGRTAWKLILNTVQGIDAWLSGHLLALWLIYLFTDLQLHDQFWSSLAARERRRDSGRWEQESRKESTDTCAYVSRGKPQVWVLSEAGGGGGSDPYFPPLRHRVSH